jgi:2-polyprenyl-3-methyl-5-hydroxy-6-metoxy-1,4-benzoquinol methylase
VNLDEHRSANLRNWEERVPAHTAPGGYDVDRLLADPGQISRVVGYDAPRLGDLTGQRVLHLQCHIGTDTLSLARLGASVTGVDFSPAALAAARDLCARAGVDARFVESEVYDAPSALAGETFDLVYTSVGVLNWLPDISGWGQVVAALLRPGGRLFLREFHPMVFTIDERRTDDLLVVTYPYFETEDPLSWDDPTTYGNVEARLESSVTYEWNHGLAETVMAVIDAGLRLDALVEHRELEWQMLPQQVQDDAGRWVLPHGPERLPLMFTLMATKTP